MSHPARQRGIALAVVMILLLVITLLALASLRGTLLEERMSRNVIDRGQGFQAAEAALREGEKLAATRPEAPASGCTNGICGKPDPATAADNQRWSDANWEDNSRAATVEVDGVAEAPRFMIELMQDGLPSSGDCTTSIDVSPDAECSGDEVMYRITARSESADRADVTLQSTYIVP
ncbi:MAG: pilus assembly PilX family protein [Luteimonas sp.]|jgi:type IV pilus assembly protein PilX